MTHRLPARLAAASRAGLVIALVAVGCAAPGVSPSTTGATAPPTPTAAAPASQPAPSNAEPPDALLTLGTMAPIPGVLGTYTWLGTGSDAPWLRGTPVTLPPGGTATVSLKPPVGTASWSIRKAKPGDASGTTARQIAAGTGPIAFTVPPEAGTILLTVDFAGGVGTANYFWALSTR
jgi:hypothetical protein